MSGFPVQHGDNHGGPLGHGPLAAVNRGYLDTDPVVALLSHPKRRQTRRVRPVSFIPNCSVRAPLDPALQGDRLSLLPRLVATLSSGGPEGERFACAPLYRPLSNLRTQPSRQASADVRELHSSSPFVVAAFDAANQPREARNAVPEKRTFGSRNDH